MPSPSSNASYMLSSSASTRPSHPSIPRCLVVCIQPIPSRLQSYTIIHIHTIPQWSKHVLWRPYRIGFGSCPWSAQRQLGGGQGLAVSRCGPWFLDNYRWLVRHPIWHSLGRSRMEHWGIDRAAGICFYRAALDKLGSILLGEGSERETRL